jgi:hypothetical protein
LKYNVLLRTAGQRAVIIERISIRIHGNALADIGTVATAIVNVRPDIPAVLQRLTGVGAHLLLRLLEVPEPRLVGGRIVETGKGAFCCSEKALGDLGNGTARDGRGVHPATADFAGGVLAGHEAVKGAGEAGLLELLKGLSRSRGPEQAFRFGHDIHCRTCQGVHVLKGGTKGLRRRIGTLRRNEIGEICIVLVGLVLIILLLLLARVERFQRSKSAKHGMVIPNH